MNPAFSVIFLTTLIGAGQGLFLAIVLGQAYFSDMSVSAIANGGESGILNEEGGDGDGSFIILGCSFSMLLLALGLIASFFHLGHPERAWRAVSQWKTSWLSREVIILPLVMGIVAMYGAIHMFGETHLAQFFTAEVVSVLGWIGFCLVIILYICTAMIYACIKFIQEWSSPLTVINYTVLGLASGFVLATALSFRLEHSGFPLYFGLSLSLMLIGLITRSFSLYRNARLKPKSSIQTAIGIKHRQITQRSQGFMGGSFNTRDFFHHCTEQFMISIKWVALFLVFILPSVLLFIGWFKEVAIVFWLAFAVQYVGLLAERWLFFAQANHPQNLYYQSVS